MEKTQKKMDRMMIEAFYREPMTNIFQYYIDKSIDEIIHSLIIDGEKVSGFSERGQKVLEHLLKTDKVKKILIMSVNSINASDCCAEILKQYGLADLSDSTFLHDEMMRLFFKVRLKIIRKISNG